jgi:general secretion pathway protein E
MEYTHRFPYSFAKQYGVVAHYLNDILTVHYKNELAPTLLLEMRRFLGQDFSLKKISSDEFQKMLAKAYESGSNAAEQLAADLREDTDLLSLMQELPKHQDLLETEDGAPIIRLLNALFSEALKLRASDIHIETFEDNVTVRFRIDGVLREIIKPERILAPMIISRIKVMAKLDIAEKRLPQDGRIALHIAARNVDVRVSTLPTSHGERIVLRLLDKQNAKLDLATLGMLPNDVSIMENLISKPHGIILVTGPTGSGKTTTLYAALTDLNESSRNILTVEDPIEYDLPGVGQTQVNIKVDMTFARGLRAILRQDPDIVMVGEIRDLETAEIAIQASLTGHLVLSTLHTNSAVGAITRLHDMGVEPFLLSSSLIGVIAQRLVRVLCRHCKKTITPSMSECKLLNIDETHPIFSAVGCEHCGFTGYAGQMGFYEMLPISENLRGMIHDKNSEQALEKYARTKWPSIQIDGMKKVIAGFTTVEEVLRVTSTEI